MVCGNQWQMTTSTQNCGNASPAATKGHLSMQGVWAHEPPLTHVEKLHVCVLLRGGLSVWDSRCHTLGWFSACLPTLCASMCAGVSNISTDAVRREKASKQQTQHAMQQIGQLSRHCSHESSSMMRPSSVRPATPFATPKGWKSAQANERP